MSTHSEETLRVLTQGVLLAVRLWGRMPAAVLKECAILPQQSPQPPRTFFTAAPAAAPAPVVASAAFFAARHLAGLSEALVASSLSHPRIHSVWLSLLALLLPGFTPTKVSSFSTGTRMWEAIEPVLENHSVEAHGDFLSLYKAASTLFYEQCMCQCMHLVMLVQATRDAAETSMVCRWRVV